MGIEAFPIAATPESILVSPQAISVNGSAVLNTPSTIAGTTIERISVVAGRMPRLTKTIASSGNAEKTSLRAIVVVGASSSTAILMNMNEAPQIAASRSRRATYPRISAGYRSAPGPQSRRESVTDTREFPT